MVEFGQLQPYARAMRVLLNGEDKTIDDGVTLGSLIEKLELVGKRLAVEVNEEVVPRSSYRDFALGDGDRIEIVHAIGGG